MPVELRGRSHLRRVHIDKPVDVSPASVSAETAKTAVVSDVPKAHVALSKPGAGSHAALVGLRVVDSPRKPGWSFRQAVAGALVGLHVLGNLAPQARDPQTTAPPHNELVLPSLPVAGGPPVAGAHAGLADTLLTLTSGMRVTHGTDPGDFYCEHAFFTSSVEASSPGSSVLKNNSGEVLTAFLHNPSDAFTYDKAKTPVQRERHAERRQIIGAAIRGYYDDARGQIGDAPFRMMITGYLQWGSVVNNPTGDFVAHHANIDAAMKAAFGDALMTPHGKGNGTVLEYKIFDAGKIRKIDIDAVALPVSDDAINGGPQSLQSEMAQFKPHAVLSMGVAGGSPTFLAEFHADNGGLSLVNGKQAHDDGKEPDKNTPDNYSLARALIAGSKLFNPHDGVLRPAPIGGV